MRFLAVLTLSSCVWLSAAADAGAQAARTGQTRARTATTVTVAVRVTDGTGAPLTGIKVSASGPVPRVGTTDEAGVVRFQGMKPGDYRLRFQGEGVITLERDTTVRSNAATADLEVMLSPAPPPPAAAPPPAAPEPAEPPRSGLPPPPSPRTVSIPDFVERNPLGSREPHKSSVVACGGTSVVSLLQLRDSMKDRVHEQADELLYVVGGEGLLVLPAADVRLQAGVFSLVPRGVKHSIERRGRTALILMSTLTDTPCDALKP